MYAIRGAKQVQFSHKIGVALAQRGGANMQTIYLLLCRLYNGIWTAQSAHIQKLDADLFASAASKDCRRLQCISAHQRSASHPRGW